MQSERKTLTGVASNVSFTVMSFYFHCMFQSHLIVTVFLHAALAVCSFFHFDLHSLGGDMAYNRALSPDVCLWDDHADSSQA